MPSFMWNVEGCNAQRAQQPHAADAQQNFLHDARGAVAAVNAQGQIAEMLFVLGQIRVEQINRHAADIHAPGLEDTPGSWRFPPSRPAVRHWRSSTGSSGRFFGFSRV